MVPVTLRVLSVSCFVLYVRLRDVSERSGGPGSVWPARARKDPPRVFRVARGLVRALAQRVRTLRRPRVRLACARANRTRQGVQGC